MKFEHCPKCGRRGVDHGGERGGEKHLCRVCGYEFYFNPAPGVSVIVENAKGEILLVRRARAPQKGYWDFLGGFVDQRESVEEAVEREAKEEIGVPVRSIAYISSAPGRYLYRGVNYHTVNLIMRAEILSEKIIPADDVSEVRFFGKNKIPWRRLAFSYMKGVLREYVRR